MIDIRWVGWHYPSMDKGSLSKLRDIGTAQVSSAAVHGLQSQIQLGYYARTAQVILVWNSSGGIL